MSQDISNSNEKFESAITLKNLILRENSIEQGQAADEYDPSANRDKEKCTSSSGALAHLLKSSLGTGILAMPMAFHNAGLLFGLLGSFVVGFICTHCVQILVQTSQNMCRVARVPALGFAETAEKVFEYGPPALRPWSNFAKQFVDGSLMVTHYAGVAIYIVFSSTSLHDVINYNFHLDWDIRIYVTFVLIPCLLIAQIRDLKLLIPFSTMANILVIITFGITVYYMCSEPLVFSDKPLIARTSQIPIFFATVVFALEGIGVVMPVENSMKNPKHFLGCPGVLNIAMLTVVSLYTIVGFFGYVRFGDKVRGSLTLNLPEGSHLADTAKLLMAVAAVFTYGLQFYVPSEILWRKTNHMFKKQNHNVVQILLRSSMVLTGYGIAIAIPELEPFISLIGSVFFSLLGFLMPSLIETIYLWPNNLGWCKWKLLKNIFLAVMAICALCAGATISLDEILKRNAAKHM